MRIEDNFDLTMYNSYRIKSTCRRAFFPSCEEEFVQIFTEYKNRNKIILGGGFNVILSKEQYEEDFVLIGNAFSDVCVSGKVIEAEAGVDLKSLSEIALSKGLTKMEMFYDIPSSLGGAVVMNAGASGEEIKDILLKVRYLDLVDMKVKEILREDLTFEYRNSFFQQNKDKIIMRVWLGLERGNPKDIRAKMDRIKAARWEKQPKEFPNAGSVFKRPKGYYVGAIIDDLKLKGFSVGGAKVSEKHGGFIVNYNGATGKDIIAIIDEIRNKVLAKYGIELEIEQRII